MTRSVGEYVNLRYRKDVSLHGRGGVSVCMQYVRHVILLWFISVCTLQGQDSVLIEEKDLLLGLPEPTLPPVPPKKKPIPRNMFFGLRVSRKSLTKSYKGGRLRERFYHLRKKHVPQIPPNIPYVYWYSRSKQKIMYTPRTAPRDGLLLHGRYQKKWKKHLIEERYFYHGVPHGRWIWLSSQDILLDKRRYFKGWSADAKTSYYDPDRLQVKEVIPIQHGVRSGPYYAFHSNTQIAVTGKYVRDNPIALWKEYYENGQIKRELQYPDTPDGTAQAYISREWDRDGTLFYEKKIRKQHK